MARLAAASHRFCVTTRGGAGETQADPAALVEQARIAAARAPLLGLAFEGDLTDVLQLSFSCALTEERQPSPPLPVPVTPSSLPCVADSCPCPYLYKN